LKGDKIEAINHMLHNDSTVDIQPRFNGVNGNGEHQLILCTHVLDYQESSSKKKQSWQVLGVDGEIFDFTASGPITLVNDIDLLYQKIEESQNNY
tara:strand:+ start:334 stop:618 length:285 start_codon:yes stop_codon:yes gene_type:complete